MLQCDSPDVLLVKVGYRRQKPTHSEYFTVQNLDPQHISLSRLGCSAGLTGIRSWRSGRFKGSLGDFSKKPTLPHPECGSRYIYLMLSSSYCLLVPAPEEKKRHEDRPYPRYSQTYLPLTARIYNTCTTLGWSRTGRSHRLQKQFDSAALLFLTSYIGERHLISFLF